MQFTKITLFSLIAIAAAVPNPLPEAEPALEARTWGFNYHDNICDCQCSRNGNHKRELDTRTFTIITKILCYKKCKKECDEYYDNQYKICVKKAEEKLHQCKNACHNPHKRDALPEPEPEANPTNNNYNPENCKKQCQEDYESDLRHCKAQWSH